MLLSLVRADSYGRVPLDRFFVGDLLTFGSSSAFVNSISLVVLRGYEVPGFCSPSSSSLTVLKPSLTEASSESSSESSSD